MTLPIPGRLSRWVASDATGSDGAAASAISDSWGSDDVVQATTANQPTLHTTGPKLIGGQPVISCDPSVTPRHLTGAATRTLQPFTVALVIRLDDRSTYRAPFGGEDGYRGMAYRVDPDGHSTLYGVNAPPLINGALPAFPEDTPQIVVATYDEDGNYTLYLNSATASVLGNYAPFAIGPSLVRIGGDSTGFPWSGEIAEVDLWSRVVTDSEVGDIMADHSATYSIALDTRDPQAFRFVQLDAIPGTLETTALILVPVDNDPSVAAPVLLYCHGVGGGSLELADAARSQFTPLLAQNGIIQAASDMGGASTWGNSAALDDTVDLYDYIAARYALGSAFICGGSMGGLGSQLLVADGRIPAVAGWLGHAPVCSLRHIYDDNGTFAGYVRTAYGIASDGSDYDALTAGHDPYLIDPAEYGAVPFHSWQAPDDAVVNPARHANLQMPRLADTRPESVATATSSGTGGHASLDQIRPEEMLEFIQRYIVVPPPAGTGAALLMVA